MDSQSHAITEERRSILLLYQAPDSSFPCRTRTSVADDAALRFVSGITVRLEHVVVAIFTLDRSVTPATPTRRRTLPAIA